MPNDNGEYCVYCQMLVGSSYQYGVLLFNSEEEARNAKEGDNVDVERTIFSKRANIIQL